MQRNAVRTGAAVTDAYGQLVHPRRPHVPPTPVVRAPQAVAPVARPVAAAAAPQPIHAPSALGGTLPMPLVLLALALLALIWLLSSAVDRVPEALSDPGSTAVAEVVQQPAVAAEPVPSTAVPPTDEVVEAASAVQVSANEPEAVPAPEASSGSGKSAVADDYVYPPGMAPSAVDLADAADVTAGYVPGLAETAHDGTPVPEREFVVSYSMVWPADNTSPYMICGGCGGMSSLFGTHCEVCGGLFAGL